jgi:hypothetical protein
MELENFTLSEVSQAHKIKGHMFSLICGSYTYKINVCILNIYDHIYIHLHIFYEQSCISGGGYERRERERKC